MFAVDMNSVETVKSLKDTLRVKMSREHWVTVMVRVPVLSRHFKL